MFFFIKYHHLNSFLSLFGGYFIILLWSVSFFSSEKRQKSEEGQEGSGEDDHHGDVRTDDRARLGRGEDLQGSQRDLPFSLPAGKIHHSELRRETWQRCCIFVICVNRQFFPSSTFRGDNMSVCLQLVKLLQNGKKSYWTPLQGNIMAAFCQS